MEGLEQLFRAMLAKDKQKEQTMQALETMPNPTINEIVSLLKQAEYMPQMTLDPNLMGTTTRGAYRPFGNSIAFNPRGFNQTTVAHELTHALDAAMANTDYATSKGRKYFQGPQMLQFKNAWDKLKSNPPLPRKDPKDYYRNAPDETRAFGASKFAEPERKYQNFYPDNPHVDATAATEAAILRELYAKALREGKK